MYYIIVYTVHANNNVNFFLSLPAIVEARPGG